ncbi:MAG: signal recognition particle-docking protein FtsY [Burkholderiaceae bacterium]|jgi:fused signal recognition particle receptor|nr:signal recognition particle-docking protein FtsY [Burkholderiaceae bacterium]
MSRLKEGLTRTRVNIVGLFSGGVIDDALFDELEIALIGADVGVATTTELLDALRARIKLKGLKTADEVRTALKDELGTRLAVCEGALDLERGKPIVMMVAGVNGAGKTTSIGKLAHWLADRRQTVLLAAGDTFRAAAREQLAVWGQRNGVEVIQQASGDPAAVVFDAVQATRARGIDVLIADTAGRLPTQLHLMDELKRIKRALQKAGDMPVHGRALEGVPHEVLLVIDGTNGQNALAQVRAFDEAIGLTGLIITKLDGTAKGGVLAALARERRAADKQPIPILFIGVGEKLDDLQPFVAREFAEALIG